jgi:hypothetical protein
MGTILGLDGKPFDMNDKETVKKLIAKKASVTDDSQPDNPYFGRSRAQKRQMQRGQPDMTQYQTSVVSTCIQMLREAKIPAALIAFPSENGQIKEACHLTMDNYELIKHQLDKHQEAYGHTTPSASLPECEQAPSGQTQSEQ